MNYEIIKNPDLLKAFINWLPELGEDEIYYLALFARKKYSPELKFTKTDKTQLKRFTSDKQRLFSKIKQLECELGSYELKGTPAPQESLALYVTVNPRSQKSASRGLLIKLAQLVGEPYNGHNLHQEALSLIQKSKSDTRWVDFDLDCPKGTGLVMRMKIMLTDSVGVEAFKIIETRGGYHILVNPKKVTNSNKIWHKQIRSEFECDVVGDNMIPVIGCTQGGFIPKFI